MKLSILRQAHEIYKTHKLDKIMANYTNLYFEALIFFKLSIILKLYINIIKYKKSSFTAYLNIFLF